MVEPGANVDLPPAYLPLGRSLPPLPTTADTCVTPSVATLDPGWRFRTDPVGVGVTEQWYSPETGYAGWRRLAPGEPGQSGGPEYDGVAVNGDWLTVPSNGGGGNSHLPQTGDRQIVPVVLV